MNFPQPALYYALNPTTNNTKAMSESECNNPPAMPPGLFGWNELITSDREAAKQFYAATFGWVAETREMAPGFEYTLFKLGGATVGGMIHLPPDSCPAKPQWLSYVLSADIGADLAKAKAAGAEILKEATEIPNTGTLAILRDPQGAVFALWKCTVAPCE